MQIAGYECPVWIDLISKSFTSGKFSGKNHVKIDLARELC